MAYIYHFLRLLFLHISLVTSSLHITTELSNQAEQEANNSTAPTAKPRPLYTIAHQVLTIQGVDDALAQGANAVEIDVTTGQSGWWADHDRSGESAGDSVEEMFQAIANRRVAGANIVFVWLDINHSNDCDPGDPTMEYCAITALQEQARRILEPADVRVLYGFYHSAAYGVGYDYICGHLNGNEAINLDGDALAVIEGFESSKIFNIKQRVMSYGSDYLFYAFGNCHEDQYYTCTELRKGSESKRLGQVYGWTLTTGQKEYADLLLNDGGVDGIIYGFGYSRFNGSEDTRVAFQYIKDWVDTHPELRYLATAEDPPW